MLRPLRDVIDRLDRSDRLGSAARAGDALSGALNRGTVGAALRGDWLGHELHPLLTDLPIGFWTSSFVLDVVGGAKARPASQRLIGLGLLSMIPTAAAGWVDYGKLEDEGKRRNGVAHAVTNAATGVLYYASWRSRRRGHYLVGVGIGLAAGGVASVAGFLGGHLAFGSSVAANEVDLDQSAPPVTDHSLDGKIGA